MRLHLCYERLKHISNFSELAYEFETRLAWTETAHFAFASFRKILICDLWAFGGFSFIKN